MHIYILHDVFGFAQCDKLSLDSIGRATGIWRDSYGQHARSLEQVGDDEILSWVSTFLYQVEG